MTNIGEGIAVTTVKETKPGELWVQVRDICEGHLIEGAEVSIGSDKKTTESSGEVNFTKLPEGAVSVRAKKHFEDADYIKFIRHIPRIVRKYQAKSSSSGSAEVLAGDKFKLRLEMQVYKVIDSVKFRRIHLKLKPLDYGHWWVEVGNSKSYGWWPEEGHLQSKDMEEPEPPPSLAPDASATDKIQHLSLMATYYAKMARYKANYSAHGFYAQAIGKTLKGVPGVLNSGGEYLKKERDPHHGDGKFQEEYSPVINDCQKPDDLHEKIKDFSFSFSGNWSWRFETFGGRNCHSFQIDMINTIGLDKFKQTR